MCAKRFEDFTVNQADIVGTGIQELLDRDLIWDLEPLMVGKQLLIEDDSLVGTAGVTKTFRRRSQYSDAEAFSEGADVPDTTGTVVGPSNTLVKVTPTKFGIGDTITEEAIDAADFNVIREHQLALARAMARRSDQMIWNAILNVTTGTETVTGVAATSKFNLHYGNGRAGHDQIYIHAENLEIDAAAAVLGTDATIDMYKGIITFAAVLGLGHSATFDFVITDRTNRVDATTAGTLALTDLVKAKLKITDAYGAPDTGVFYPDELGDLQVDDKFIDASAYGSRDPILNGEIGKASGISLLTSHRMYPGCGVVVQKGSRLGYYVYKKKPKAGLDVLQKKSGDCFIKAWERSGVGIIDELMISVITNMQFYAAHMTYP